MPEQRPATPDEIIDGYAELFKVPSALARAVMQRESGGDQKAVGDNGQAIGAFQLHQGAATDTGVTDRANPAQNIMGGVKYLSQLSERYKGDVAKTLQAYNGGMENVDAGSVSPEAQAYAQAVISSMTREAATAKPTGKLTDESQPISAQTRKMEMAANRPAAAQPSYSERVGQIFQNTPAGQIFEGLKGAGKELVKRTQREPTEASKPFTVDAVKFKPGALEPTNTAQKVGGLAEQGAEFLGAGGAVEGALKKAPLLAKAAGGAAVNYGVSKFQGASELGSRINATLGALGPVVSEAMPALGAVIRDRAVKQLSLKLSKGLAEPNPAVEYGLKTGDISPDVADPIRIVRKAASDILDAPVRASWGKWLATLGKENAAKGKDLGDALASPLGDAMLFKQPIYDELDKLVKQSAQHLANTPSSTGGGLGGGVQNVTYNPDMLHAVNALKETLDQYAPMISVRNLSDLKRSWDDIVYTLSTSGKVGLGTEALLNNAKKKVASTSANSIRAIFDQHAPTIDALNEAASNAYRLQDLVQKVFTKQPGMGVMGKVAAGTAGSVGGFLAGQMVGHPYVAMGMGAAASRAFVKAFESPLFQTLSPAVKNKLAQAVAQGNNDVVLKLLAPILEAGVSKQSSPRP